MKMIQPTRMLASLAFCILLGACSTGRSGAEKAPLEQAASQSSSFEITYSLGGHGQHHLSGFSTGSNPQLAAYLDRAVIEERMIGAESYNRYFAKVLEFAQRTQRAPSQDQECRTPYSIVVKIDGKTYSSKGCRASKNAGDFGSLLRDGEFLLYSKK